MSNYWDQEHERRQAEQVTRLWWQGLTVGIGSWLIIMIVFNLTAAPPWLPTATALAFFGLVVVWPLLGTGLLRRYLAARKRRRWRQQ